MGRQAISASTALAWSATRVDHGRGLVRGDLPAAENGVTPALDIIRTSEALAELQSEWEDLYLRSSPRNPFLSHAWSDACWRARTADAQLFVAALRDMGRLIAVAPLCIEKRAGFRILRFIGEDRSDYLGFLCDPAIAGLEQQLLAAVLTAHCEWDLALLRQLADSYTTVHEQALSQAFRSRRTEWTRAPYCASEGDWEALETNGPSWLKRTRKRLRRFLKDGWEIERFTGHDAARRLDSVSDIEARSWKGRERAARLQPGSGQDLLRHAFERDDGEHMELWLASIDGKPVAFQIDFLLADRLWVYQQAYDDDYKRTSVGSFMAYVSFEAAWRAGVREYDYLSGEEPYKLERTNASRSIHHLAVHRRSPRGWLAYGLLVAPRWRLRNVRALRAAYKAAQGLKRHLLPQSNA